MLKKVTLIFLGLALCFSVYLSANDALANKPKDDTVTISIFIDCGPYSNEHADVFYHLNIPSIGISKIMPMTQNTLMLDIELPTGNHTIALGVSKANTYLGMATAEVKIEYTSTFTKISRCTSGSLHVLMSKLCEFYFSNNHTWIDFRATLKK